MEDIINIKKEPEVEDESIILCTNCIHYNVCCDENWEDPAMQYCGERLVKVE